MYDNFSQFDSMQRLRISSKSEKLFVTQWLLEVLARFYFRVKVELKAGTFPRQPKNPNTWED